MGVQFRFFAVVLSLTLIGCGVATKAQVQPEAQVRIEELQDRCTATAEIGAKKLVVSEIVNILRGGDFTKKEFETTDEFKKRLSSRIEQVNRLAQSKDGTLAVLVPIPEHRIRYQADSAKILIGSELGLLNASLYDYIVAERTERTTGSYIGSNAFGVSREVYQTQRAELGLRFPGSYGFYDSWPGPFNPAAITMPREEAQKSKKSFGVLFIGQLKPPYLSRVGGRKGAKLDDPEDVDTKAEVLEMDVICAVIYNRATDKIVRGITFKRSRF